MAQQTPGPRTGSSPPFLACDPKAPCKGCSPRISAPLPTPSAIQRLSFLELQRDGHSEVAGQGEEDWGKRIPWWGFGTPIQTGKCRHSFSCPPSPCSLSPSHHLLFRSRFLLLCNPCRSPQMPRAGLPPGGERRLLAGAHGPQKAIPASQLHSFGSPNYLLSGYLVLSNTYHHHKLLQFCASV